MMMEQWPSLLFRRFTLITNISALLNLYFCTSIQKGATEILVRSAVFGRHFTKLFLESNRWNPAQNFNFSAVYWKKKWQLLLWSEPFLLLKFVQWDLLKRHLSSIAEHQLRIKLNHYASIFVDGSGSVRFDKQKFQFRLGSVWQNFRVRSFPLL